ncbi:hypothetical protein J27TS7_10410 [Paenibacillus dendritiformis]|nr:hypothetical protein J27TS7_10410 [Paenibacillus dendritiformis]
MLFNAVQALIVTSIPASFKFPEICLAASHLLCSEAEKQHAELSQILSFSYEEYHL